MIVVIVAGGSGTRLWPLSTQDFPKHLLKLDGDESLLQNTYRRASELTEHIYVVTETGHAHHVREQLPQLKSESIIAEPARRGTANCILAGLYHIGKHHDPNEPIAFIAADHFVRDTGGFTQSFHVAAHATQKHNRICLVGVEPTYASTGLGYIEKDKLLKGEDMVYEVARFKEKPPHNVAQEYIKSGRYLWNCSYFVGSHRTFLETIKTYSPWMHGNYQQLLRTANEDSFNKTYLSFDTNSIDFALNDYVDNFLVVPAMFDWMDVGSFQDLYSVNENITDADGNAIKGGHVILDDVQNSLIHNAEDKPLAVVGLDNVAVINSPNGILVLRKDLAQKVGEIAKKLQL